MRTRRGHARTYAGTCLTRYPGCIDQEKRQPAENMTAAKIAVFSKKGFPLPEPPGAPAASAPSAQKGNTP